MSECGDIITARKRELQLGDPPSDMVHSPQTLSGRFQAKLRPRTQVRLADLAPRNKIVQIPGPKRLSGRGRPRA